MKNLQVILSLAVAAVVTASQANPLAKVFDLVESLKSKIVADGEAEGKAYQKFVQFCGSTSKDVQYEIDTATALENKLTSKVTKLAGDIVVGETRVGDFTGDIAKTEAELKGATAIRKKEAAEFVEGEKTLMSTVDELERALSTLEKQMAGGKSFAQLDLSELTTIVQTLGFVDDAAALDGNSMDKLTSLIQAHDDESDSELGAPAAASYNKQSGGIMESLEDMRDKAESQLSDLRKNEMTAKNSYELLRQGLEDEIKAAKTELSDEQSGKAEANEEKAGATGNLEVTTKEKKIGQQKEDQVSSACQTAATDHEANVASRAAELKVIGEAEQILKESTGGADAAASFLQVRSASKSHQRGGSQQASAQKVISMVQQLAKQHHSASLAQLASRISADLRYSSSRRSADPFKNVKNLISSMINKLNKEAGEDATEKAYCDEEMAKTKVKNSDLEDTVEKLSTKIAKAVSKSGELKEEVTELQNELSVLTKEQASMDKIRNEDHVAHVAAKADLEQGLNGVRKALSVLRDFYGGGEAALLQESSEAGEADSDNMGALMQQAVKQPSPPLKAEKSTGAGSGIIGLLEVCESDLANNLATEDTEESDAQSTYEKQTQTNRITKAEKEGDVKGKTSQFKSLDKTISELEADKATEVDELNAVSEYWGKVKERCVAKPTSYETLLARRDAEITGLKDALASVEGEALMQVASGEATQVRHRHHSSLRGDALRAD